MGLRCGLACELSLKDLACSPLAGAILVRRSVGIGQLRTKGKCDWLEFANHNSSLD